MRVARSAVAPRGETPSWRTGNTFGGDDVDDVAENFIGDKHPTNGVPPAASSAVPATGRIMLQVSRIETAACRERMAISLIPRGSGTFSFSRNLSNCASGS